MSIIISRHDSISDQGSLQISNSVSSHPFDRREQKHKHKESALAKEQLFEMLESLLHKLMHKLFSMNSCKDFFVSAVTAGQVEVTF